MSYKKKSFKHEFLRQFYFFTSYNVSADRLFGRLLATREISPTLKDELQRADTHFDWKMRCLYCDMNDYEERSVSEAESRHVASNNSYIAFVQFAPSTKYTMSILPFSHVGRFTEISEQQQRDLAKITYHLIQTIKEDSVDEKGYVISVAFHSAPVESKDNGLDSKTKNQIEKLYHFHAEINPSRIVADSDEYRIPSSGWTVIANRPKETAQRLKRTLSRNIYSHHQP